MPQHLGKADAALDYAGARGDVQGLSERCTGCDSLRSYVPRRRHWKDVLRRGRVQAIDRFIRVAICLRTRQDHHAEWCHALPDSPRLRLDNGSPMEVQWKPNGSLNGSPNGSRENSV